jgi:protein TonB
MIDAEMNTPRRARLGAATLTAALHVVVIAVLIRAFAPDLGAALVRPATQAFDVVIRAPEPTPSPTPTPKRAMSLAEGAAAPAGKKAEPRAVAAPRPAIVLAPAVAPPIAGKGAADSSGALDAGQGTGAGGQGSGTGAGGAGAGGGGATKPIKIAGDIVSARDYPKDTRKLRLGSAVTIALSVTTEGRVSQCRIVRPSRDPEADRITCRLATERFRFRPALDSAGQPVASVYGWQQRWFKP